jgi:hypothetical protein
MEEALSISESLKVHSSLTTLNLWKNNIQDEGAIAIANALTYNPSLVHVRIDYTLGSLSGLNEFVIGTFQNLEGIPKTLIGEDGAQVLAGEFQIKSRRVVFERRGQFF